VSGSGKGLPVDVPGIVSGEIGAVVLKIEGAAGPGTGVVSGTSAPVPVFQRQGEQFRMNP
jgi:hypothetical protein